MGIEEENELASFFQFFGFLCGFLKLNFGLKVVYIVGGLGFRD